MTNKHKYLLLEIKDTLIKTRHHFLPIKITCQGTAFFHLQVCSRTYLPFRCCPRASRAETTSYTAFAGHHFIPFQLRHWESPDTRYLFQASWMKGKYSFFSFCDTLCWMNTCTILFWFPMGLLNFTGTAFHESPALCWTKE